ncbi:MAG: aldo/keto reductase [Spirochaetales bacterium]|nr:aldo/keto reductase [Spirochaetales bacterium]
MTDKPIDIVTLGNSGIRASYLAFGTGTRGYSHSSAQTRKDPQWLTNALVKSYDAGINFWDLADLYGSHPFAKKALEAFEREQVVIMTKTMAKDADGCRHDIDRFLEELGTDYLDIVLMHGKTSGNWTREDRGVMDVLSEAKKRGVIRAVGISAHSYRALETAVQEPWVDIMLVRYNYSGVQMDGDPGEIEKVMQAAQKNGKGTVAMKVLGEDALASDPEKAIRFVAQTDCVNAMTIGYQSDEELAQCVAIVKTIRQS